ncbi:predicted protein [Naegleria gruberi]|uniref:Predicted protein n=1 Tax=Naegleria gruberi TaxID=5762 RepID=D2W1L8_NAEGR|nr:uncharacterized protein NAEGRDRAFT_75267 [Naegleria gruberi]EFC37113.1 predicted protein [Naegleria gruberi]|eukprot:XP_002669857.1 predicted protein [Naegleria gruberi strain NEG-M]
MTREFRKSIEFDGNIFCILDDEHDEMYVVQSMSGGYCTKKFRLGLILEREGLIVDEPIWTSESCVSNPYGFAVYNGKSKRYMAVLNHGISSSVHLFDCKTGETIKDTIFTVPKDASCLEIIGNTLVVGGKSVSLYEIDEKLFGEGRNVLKFLNGIEMGWKAYEIIMDEANQRIIYSSDGIIVLDSKKLEKVQQVDCVEDCSGICLDQFSGELLVCYPDQIIIYK